MNFSKKSVGQLGAAFPLLFAFWAAQICNLTPLSAANSTKWGARYTLESSNSSNSGTNYTQTSSNSPNSGIRNTLTIPNSPNLSKKYARILGTNYTQENSNWPNVGIKDAQNSFNLSCTSAGGVCNNSSATNASKKKSRDLLHRLYETLFQFTHARLHPVHHRPVRVIVVDQGGHGHSRTIQGAIDMVSLDNKWRIQIIIRPGIYREKVYVPYRKPFITFQGSGSGVTVITWNARAGDKNQGGNVLGTFGSASVAVDSDYFVARDITFQNTSPSPLPGAQGMQAVALRISGDKAAFIDCRMLGAQDTLFDHVGRHFFLRCYIEGAIDFIFGDGRSLYLNCELHANAVTYGAVAASQRNSPDDNTGFSFVQCRVTGTGLIYLGRAWGQYARILFAYTYFDNIIIPDGWYDWGDTSRRETVFFGEYKCWGPGSQPRWRVSWSRQLSYEEARPFLGIGFINGHKWLNILS